jgi:regulator of cell morphogenesis and NO signaling
LLLKTIAQQSCLKNTISIFAAKGNEHWSKHAWKAACLLEKSPLALESSFESGSCIVAPSFSRLSLTQLIHYIVSIHHDYVKQEMPVIRTWLQRVASKHGDRHPEMVQVFHLFDELMNEMTEHMKKEELILFPRIHEVEAESLSSSKNEQSLSFLQSPIQMMEHEHDRAGQFIR